MNCLIRARADRYGRLTRAFGQTLYFRTLKGTSETNDASGVHQAGFGRFGAHDIEETTPLQRPGSRGLIDVLAGLSALPLAQAVLSSSDRSSVTISPCLHRHHLFPYGMVQTVGISRRWASRQVHPLLAGDLTANSFPPTTKEPANFCRAEPFVTSAALPSRREEASRIAADAVAWTCRCDVFTLMQ
jgi:hypothetical protein